MDNKMRVVTLFMGIIIVGSTLSDLDHILPPFKRSWGHNPWIVLAIFLLGLGIAYFSRLFRTRILRKITK